MNENKWNFTFPESFLKVMEELNKVQLSASALAMSPGVESCCAEI